MAHDVPFPQCFDESREQDTKALCDLCFYFTSQFVFEWILKFTKTDRETAHVVRLQTAGLVAIAISDAVHPKGSYSKLHSDEVGEVAKLLSYHSMPLNRILECQQVVCKTFPTGKCR